MKDIINYIMYPNFRDEKISFLDSMKYSNCCIY